MVEVFIFWTSKSGQQFPAGNSKCFHTQNCNKFELWPIGCVLMCRNWLKSRASIIFILTNCSGTNYICENLLYHLQCSSKFFRALWRSVAGPKTKFLVDLKFVDCVRNHFHFDKPHMELQSVLKLSDNFEWSYNFRWTFLDQ